MKRYTKKIAVIAIHSTTIMLSGIFLTVFYNRDIGIFIIVAGALLSIWFSLYRWWNKK